MKKRTGLLVGAVLFLMIVTQCSGRIWSIEVQGGYLHTKQQLHKVLREEMQIQGGVPSSFADCFEIEKRLRLDYSEIGWVSVEKRGCRLFVMLNESVMPEIRQLSTVPRHIVAERDGIVRKMEAVQGVPMVHVGDEVKKGDILISGVIPIKGDYDLIRNQPVAAEGKVYLETELLYERQLSMNYIKKTILEERQGFEIFLSDFKIFSYIPRYSEGKYDIMVDDIVPYCFEDYTAPVILRSCRCLLYEETPMVLSKEAAEIKALQGWEAFLTDLLGQGIQVIKSNITNDVHHGKLYTSGTATVCGNFVSYREIMEEEWKTDYEYNGDNP